MVLCTSELASRVHLAMFGDIFSSQNLGEVVVLLESYEYRLESLLNLMQSIGHTLTTKNCLTLNVNRGYAEKHCLE